MVSEAIYRHEYKYYINDCDCEMVDGKILLPAASWNVLRLVKR